MFARAVLDDPAAFRVRKRILIYTTRTQCVINVRQRHDPRTHRYCVSGETVGITAAVPLLMVRPRDGNAHVDKSIPWIFLSYGSQCAFANYGMGLHMLEFFRRQPGGLEQNRVRYADLADVVQRGRVVQVVNKRVVNPVRVGRTRAERPRKGLAIAAGAFDMLARVVVAAFREIGQRLGKTTPPDARRDSASSRAI